MLEKLSQQLQNQPSRPDPLYGQLTLTLVLVLLLTGWFVYGKINIQLEQLLQKPVLAMEQIDQSKL